MADSNPVQQCAQCKKTEADLARALKQCAKCRRAQYCDRICQQTHWKEHKKECRKGPASSTSASANSATSSASPNARTNATSVGLQYKMTQPFHRLNDRKWLHERPETDVYALLIDSYRLRMEDNWNFGSPLPNSIQAGANDGVPEFREYLGKVEAKPGLLPTWWTAEKKEACVAFNDSEDYFDLFDTITKQNVQQRYGDNNMPMQMRT